MNTQTFNIGDTVKHDTHSFNVGRVIEMRADGWCKLEWNTEHPKWCPWTGNTHNDTFFAPSRLVLIAKRIECHLPEELFEL